MFTFREIALTEKHQADGHKSFKKDSLLTGPKEKGSYGNRVSDSLDQEPNHAPDQLDFHLFALAILAPAPSISRVVSTMARVCRPLATFPALSKTATSN